MTRELANRPEHPDVVLIDDVPTIELAGNLHEIGVQFQRLGVVNTVKFDVPVNELK